MFTEGSTGASYHASDTVLAPLDAEQARLLRELGLTPNAAFLQYILAPLSLRRDIAMIGALHILDYAGFFESDSSDARLRHPSR